MVMYEEAASIPLILSGPNISPHKECAPVSLIDLYPTILDIAGLKRVSGEAIHARSLFETIKQPDKDRLILSEFHDYGAQTGMFMLRQEHWKLIQYPGFKPQLFNLEKDPDEVNTLAFLDQEDMISKLGGREKILAMQNYDHTPVNEI